MRQIRRSRVSFYETDLAFVHDSGFGNYARRFAPELVRLLNRHLIRSGTVVELGCGSGITASHLVGSGFDVSGIDISRAMIRFARARVPCATFRVGSIWSVPLPRCIAAVAIGEVITYATVRAHGVDRLESLFHRVHDALLPGGVFIFDFMESAEGRTYTGKSHAGPDWALTVSAATDRTGRWLTRRIMIFRHIGGRFRRTQEIHRVRLFDREEVGRALAATGFAVRFQGALGRMRLPKGDVIAVATPHTNRLRPDRQWSSHGGAALTGTGGLSPPRQKP